MGRWAGAWASLAWVQVQRRANDGHEPPVKVVGAGGGGVGWGVRGGQGGQCHAVWKQRKQQQPSMLTFILFLCPAPHPLACCQDASPAAA